MTKLIVLVVALVGAACGGSNLVACDLACASAASKVPGHMCPEPHTALVSDPSVPGSFDRTWCSTRCGFPLRLPTPSGASCLESIARPRKQRERSGRRRM